MPDTGSNEAADAANMTPMTRRTAGDGIVADGHLLNESLGDAPGPDRAPVARVRLPAPGHHRCDACHRHRPRRRYRGPIRSAAQAGTDSGVLTPSGWSGSRSRIVTNCRTAAREGEHRQQRTIRVRPYPMPLYSDRASG
jgi:hypothetical protein